MPELWPCGHLADAVCAECFGKLKEEVKLLREDVNYLKAESKYFETRTPKSGKKYIERIISQNTELSKLLNSKIERIREVTTERNVLQAELNTIYKFLAEVSESDPEE